MVLFGVKKTSDELMELQVLLQFVTFTFGCHGLKVMKWFIFTPRFLIENVAKVSRSNPVVVNFSGLRKRHVRVTLRNE
jgi:hypothetical protein